MRWFKFSFWNEKVIPVYEGNWNEWVAPRWYLVVVSVAYFLYFSMIIYGIAKFLNA